MTPAYELNGQAVARSQFYAIACDPRRSVAVEACAGAGKTWMLVSRILRALLDGTAPHEILAITFTKKAAGEMRQRLAEWLTQFANDQPEVLQQELQSRGMDEALAKRQCAALAQLQEQLLVCARPVQIRTFHSWFAALLRSAPLVVMQALGLPVNYELLEDDHSAVQQVWHPFFQRLLDQPVAKADFEALVASHGRAQALKALEVALSKRVEFTLADAHSPVERSVPPFADLYPEWREVDAPDALLLGDGRAAQQLRAAWSAAAIALGRAKQPSYQALGGQLELALAQIDLPQALRALLTADGGQRKLSDKLDGIDCIRQAQELALRLVQAQRQHDAWVFQQRMCRLTRLLVVEFAALKRARGWIDMNDVELAAHRLLSDPVLAGWMQEKLDTRVRHLLIDEFQDTSPLQWQALYAWLSSYAGAGQAPTVFIVGDPKQSIYRFRRAEPQVFRAAKAFVREGLGGDLLSCDHTRRNARAVLATVNAVMGQAVAAGEYQAFRPHSSESTALGAIGHLPLIERDAAAKAEVADAAGWRDSLTVARELAEETLRQRECRQVARWLADQIRQGRAAKDFLVLSRKRERLTVLQQELTALHIACDQPEKRDLAEAAEVQDVLSLLDALVSPSHNLSLARALRSPIFSLSDDALTTVALQVEADRSWLDTLLDPAVAQQVHPGIDQVLRRWQQWVGELPPHDALAAIYADGDFWARFAQAAPASLRTSVLAHLRGLLSASLDLDAARYATPYAFVRALKSSTRSPRAPVTLQPEAMQLLTIHGAKGLEAPVVVVLDCDAPPPRPQSMGILIDWPGQEPAPKAVVFLASESQVPTSVQALLAEELNERHREELNTLYVAMTRACDQLVLSGLQSRTASAGSWWQRLLPHANPLPVAELTTAVAVTNSPALTQFQLRRLPLVSTERTTQVTKALPMNAAASDSARIGQAMHRLLQWADAGNAPDAEPRLQRVAEEFLLTPAQTEQARQLALRILHGEAAWAWHADAVDWQANEVPLCWQGQLLRLDRLVRRRDSGQWWVLDYKSAGQPQGQADHVEQLQTYRQAVQSVYPEAEVRAAFLTGQGDLIQIS